MENTEVSQPGVGGKLTHVKRKAGKEESEDNTELPTKVPRNKPRLCSSVLDNLPAPGKFMKIDEALDILRHTDKVFESVPLGEKNNVFCVIDDSKNSVNRKMNLPVNYSDDCPEWKKVKATDFYAHVVKGKMAHLELRDELFCVYTHEKGKTLLTPVNPQPDPKSIINIHRYYTELIGHQNYKKRITAVSGEVIKDRALIEYCGTIIACSSRHTMDTRRTDKPNVTRVLVTNKVPHNSVKLMSESEFDSCARLKDTDIRTKQDRINKRYIKFRFNKRYTKSKSLKCSSSEVPRKTNNYEKSVHEAHEEIPQDLRAPRKIKQASNKHVSATTRMQNKVSSTVQDEDLVMIGMSPRKSKQASNKHVSATTKMQNKVSSTVQDEDLVMIGMLKEDPSVQVVLNSKNKPPSVILYSNKQFSDMKRNLECESVLGVDCTYKLGDCYVTMTVYQDSRALHKETHEPLLFLGPVFLHWDVEFLTYLSFFSHLMDKLEGIELNVEVKLGNDIILPLFKALKYSFPTSVHMVNCHHLKKTINKQLLHIVQGKLKARSTIVKKIFGGGGIASSPSLSAFENRVLGLACYFDEFPSLKTYIDELQLLLYPHVCEPYQRAISERLWLNGNDEILNNLFCTVLKRRPYRLTEIVEKICTITRVQMLKFENAW